MLYKLSVEQAIVNNIVACYNGVNDETVGELREMCSKEIAENNGIITFEEAMRLSPLQFCRQARLLVHLQE